MTPAPPGLRDRKRIQTRTRIEDAAVFLVLRDGLEATTVEAISERADVSPRTFFNYFDSKGSAILGVAPERPDEDLVVPALGGDLVEGAVLLLMQAMGMDLESRATLHDDRREIVRRYPEVLRGQMSQLSARAERLTAAIEQMMTATAVFPQDDDATARAELLTSLSMGAVRAAAREWAADGRLGPIDTIEKRAVALIKETVEKLS